MLEPGRSYDQVYRGFHWRVPERYNIGVDVCDRHAGDRDRLALVHEADDGRIETWTFARLRELSNRLANALRGLGVARGDRVGILLAQGPETAIAHIAVYKLGAVAVPLFTLFGPDALEYRLADSAAAALITDAAGIEKVLPLKDRLPRLATLVCTDGPAAGGAEFHALIERASARFAAVDTAGDDPALIIYTSGTTGPPKGALHAHRVLLGHLPGVQFPHNFFPQAGDLFWTPADWAWIGGLIDVLLPAWHFGVPVLAHRARKFDPEHAFHLIARHGVRNAFLPPTALKLMRQV
ncbi:MAG: AMP-binding protein, partial [Alphaproteobacteria bacterium]